MRRIVLPEYGQIVCWKQKGQLPESTDRTVYLEDHLYRRLERCEGVLSREEKQVFTWYSDSAQAQQWVGVVQVSGLQVEILPKIDNPTLLQQSIPDQWSESRRNLLFMLAVAGDIPIRSRDIAKLATRRAPLNETLSAIFANTLKTELLRGCERNYKPQEENLRTFKGRILLNRHLLKNTAHRERFYCGYDEYSEDTIMNRVFKAACKILLDVSHTPLTLDTLRHCLLLFEGVSDEAIHDAHIERVSFNRQNERFQDLFNFCRLILQGRAPTISAGPSPSFSLLFDMNKVFERFIASFIHTRVMPGLPDCRFYPQAVHNRRSLFQSEGSRGVLPLEPDILIRHLGQGCNLVIDTKWKKPSLGTRDARGGASREDLYQLFAYTQRYGCGRSVLLYPHVPGVTNRDLHILDDSNHRSGRTVCVRFVRVNRDLYVETERKKLASELRNLVCEGLGIMPEVQA